MVSLICVAILAIVGSTAAAPWTSNGKPPIDWTCTTSPTRSTDPVRCSAEKPVETTGQARKGSTDEEPILFEGDIAGVINAGDTIADLEMKLSTTNKGGTLQYDRWWWGYVYYEISSSFTSDERSAIMEAFKEFEKTDKVRFVPRGTNADYISIFKGAGCWSYVGQLGGMQQVSLGSGCVHYGTIVHELNHALGFWHEQSRPDRDSFVELNLDNVAQAQHHNFNKYASSVVTTSGTGYDFGSLMHYDKYAFAVDRNVWTIRPKTPYQDYEIGVGDTLSPTDIEEINALYKMCAILWYEPNYTGGELRLPVDSRSINVHASGQDQYSSAKVTPGCTLTIYTLVNGQGTATTLKSTSTGYYNFQGQTYDNDTRSVKCTCS